MYVCMYVCMKHRCTPLNHSRTKFQLVWHGTARHGTARHGTARHGTARHGTARHGTARHGTARHGTARHGTARHGTARHGTARHGTAYEIALNFSRRIVEERSFNLHSYKPLSFSECTVIVQLAPKRQSRLF